MAFGMMGFNPLERLMKERFGQLAPPPGAQPPILPGAQNFQLPDLAPPPPTMGDRVGGFFGNLDQTLQSPAKQIGIGLLGNINPALAFGGLLAGGLLGKNKVF